MWKSNLKLAFRNLKKNQLFTTIKLVGLTIGIAGCLLIGLYLHNELSYEACHQHADRIAFVVMEYHSGDRTVLTENTGNKVGPTFRQVFPEVENAVRVIQYEDRVVRHEDQLIEEDNFFYADSTFFDVFTFPLIEGNPGSALKAPNQLVINRRMAEKYFPGTDPMGKTLKVDGLDYVVSAVMENPPETTQIKPDFVGSFAGLRDAAPERATWWNANYGTFLLLTDRSAIASLQAKIGPFMKSRSAETGLSGDEYVTYKLEPLRDVHLKSEVAGKFEPNGDIRYIYILLAVGVFILLIGLSTYVNLSTAASMERAREMGVQKVLGAGRGQLVRQHISEAFLVSGFALVAGLVLTRPLIPLFNRLFERRLTMDPLLHPAALASILGFGLLIALLAGLYPALAATRFQPIKVLKGNWGSQAARGSAWLRKGLIVFQFTISILLMIATLVLKGQLDFIQDKKLGYDKDFVVALPTDGRIVEKLDVFKSEFRQNSRVMGVSLAYETPTHIEGGYGIARSPTGEGSQPVTALPADEDFVRTMGIDLAAGASFGHSDIEAVRRMYSGDTTVVRGILINESQAKAFGWTPDEAVDQRVNFNGRPAQIRGVVKDFHFASMHEAIDNLVIFPDTWGNTVLVKLSGEDISGTLAFLEQKWGVLAAHRPFTYHFLDEELGAMYRAESQTSSLITTFAGLAIFLACLGLFGLASYTIIQRTKEIGIRKVLGASAAGLVGLLSQDFLKLVGISLVAAAPIAWYFMNRWLDGFAYHISLGWQFFAVAAVTAVCVAFLAVSFQSLRAALANPVESLRNE